MFLQLKRTRVRSVNCGTAVIRAERQDLPLCALAWIHHSRAGNIQTGFTKLTETVRNIGCWVMQLMPQSGNILFVLLQGHTNSTISAETHHGSALFCCQTSTGCPSFSVQAGVRASRQSPTPSLFCCEFVIKPMPEPEIVPVRGLREDPSLSSQPDTLGNANTMDADQGEVAGCHHRAIKTLFPGEREWSHRLSAGGAPLRTCQALFWRRAAAASCQLNL